MTADAALKTIDYLVIGHVTSDLQPDGSQKLGGTVSFSGLSASRLGLKTGVLTSSGSGSELAPLTGLQVVNLPAETTTAFKNTSTGHGRRQYCFSQAAKLHPSQLPRQWANPAIVHLGPVAEEIDPAFFELFPNSLLCVTLQGFLREIGQDGLVKFRDWKDREKYLPKVKAAVLSFEDLQEDENRVREYAGLCELLVVTENKRGARVYWKQEMREFPAPKRELVDDTGAGDIFAACFFHRYHVTGCAWKAARFAVELAADSVTRRYLDSIPTIEEIEHAKRCSS